MWVGRDESTLDSEMFADLPSDLRAKVSQYITMDMVVKIHLLKDEDATLQELVAQHLRPVDLIAGMNQKHCIPSFI